MTDDLVVFEQSSITPAMFQQSMDDAVAKAKTFTDIVEAQHLYTKMGTGKHLHVEAWQTIAMGYGLTPGVASSEILYGPGGEEIGAKATSVVYDQQGTVRGGAEAYCMRSESTWKNKPIHQLLSMAGTRAVSKALRLLLAWVVVLAGYEPTPAEEMDASAGHDREQSQPADPMRLCPMHDVEWFKRGKMKNHAHPIQGTDDWCNSRYMLDALNQRLVVASIVHKWDAALQADWKDRWKSMTPTEQRDAVLELEFDAPNAPESTAQPQEPEAGPEDREQEASL